MYNDTFLLKIRGFFPRKISDAICRKYIAKNVDDLIFIPSRIRKSFNQLSRYIESVYDIPYFDVDWISNNRSFNDLKEMITQKVEIWKNTNKHGYESEIMQEGDIHIEEWPLYKIMSRTDSFEFHLSMLENANNELKKKLHINYLCGRHDMYIEYSVNLYGYMSFVQDVIKELAAYIYENYNWDSYVKLLTKFAEENS